MQRTEEKSEALQAPPIEKERRKEADSQTEARQKRRRML